MLFVIFWLFVLAGAIGIWVLPLFGCCLLTKWLKTAPHWYITITGFLFVIMCERGGAAFLSVDGSSNPPSVPFYLALIAIFVFMAKHLVEMEGDLRRSEEHTRERFAP